MEAVSSETGLTLPRVVKQELFRSRDTSVGVTGTGGRTNVWTLTPNLLVCWLVLGAPVLFELRLGPSSDN